MGDARKGAAREGAGALGGPRGRRGHLRPSDPLGADRHARGVRAGPVGAGPCLRLRRPVSWRSTSTDPLAAALPRGLVVLRPARRCLAGGARRSSSTRSASWLGGLLPLPHIRRSHRRGVRTRERCGDGTTGASASVAHFLLCNCFTGSLAAPHLFRPLRSGGAGAQAVFSRPNVTARSWQLPWWVMAIGRRWKERGPAGGAGSGRLRGLGHTAAAGMVALAAALSGAAGGGEPRHCCSLTDGASRSGAPAASSRRRAPSPRGWPDGAASPSSARPGRCSPAGCGVGGAAGAVGPDSACLGPRTKVGARARRRGALGGPEGGRHEQHARCSRQVLYNLESSTGAPDASGSRRPERTKAWRGDPGGLRRPPRDTTPSRRLNVSMERRTRGGCGAGHRGPGPSSTSR